MKRFSSILFGKKTRRMKRKVSANKSIPSIKVWFVVYMKDGKAFQHRFKSPAMPVIGKNRVTLVFKSPVKFDYKRKEFLN